MASKQPFKFINITQKLTTWSIRINKFFKHRLLSKRKHVLLIGEDQSINLNTVKGLFVLDPTSHKLKKITRQLKPSKQNSASNFEQVLIKNLYKTWQINLLKSINKDIQNAGLIYNNPQPSQANDSIAQKDITKSKPQKNQQQPSTIVISKFGDKESIEVLEKDWLSKRKLFDSIIVMPQKQEPHIYPQISDEAFATTFISTFEEKILKNVVAYRYAHKFLNTSGTVIQSVSEYDFIKKTEEEKKKEEQKKLESKDNKKDDDFQYVTCRPAASKQIIDGAICYMGVVLGDRDHTDLNSWTLVSLGEQASWRNPQYAGKMYYDWADGQQLPMPGSFALFRKKVFTDKKQLDFIQYL